MEKYFVDCRAAQFDFQPFAADIFGILGESSTQFLFRLATSFAALVGKAC